MEKCNEHTGCVTEIKRNKQDIQTLFKDMSAIKNRPPLWCSLLVTIMGCAITWLVKG